MDLEVIGVGFGGCGTMSTKVALEKLGYKTHHMIDVLKLKPEHLPLWKKVGEGDEEVLKEIFAGFTACVDFPGCYYYKQFMKWDPNAKVLLNVRDSPEVWEKSARDTICHPTDCPLQNDLTWMLSWIPYSWSYYVWYFGKMVYRSNKVLPGDNTDLLDPKCDIKQVYIDWIAEVKSTVPSDKLLVFNVKQGWTPLCEFLDKPIPDEPFPRTNDSAQFRTMMGKMKTAGRVIKLVLTSATLGVLSYCYFDQLSVAKGQLSSFVSSLF